MRTEVTMSGMKMMMVFAVVVGSLFGLAAALYISFMNKRDREQKKLNDRR